jgi:alpha-2-macroglobulin-like protein
MKKIILLLHIVAFQFVFSQNTTQKLTQFYNQNKSEKVYLHLNNVLYLPEEVAHYKIYVTNPDNSVTDSSEYVYVDVMDASNKKIETQTYLVENGSAIGSFTIKKELPSGIYKLKAYTQWQNVLQDVAFETSFFVQKVVSPRILMALEFKKKGYGKSETCEADFELKSIENQPLKNYRFSYEVFLEGKKAQTLTGQTNQEGKAIVTFKLPENLTSTDGIVNVLVDYDNYQESITRSIPINLNFVDVQFLPESGHYVQNQECTLYFITKNQFGLPLDISGDIVDQDGKIITNFSSLHDGMGKFALNAKENTSYFAKITSPFVSEKPIALPEAKPNAFVINALGNSKFKLYAPQDISGEVLARNGDKIHKTIKVDLKTGWNEISIDPTAFPVGIQTLSLVVNDNIVAEKVLFLNYQNGLQIEIKTDKKSYLPREKVKVAITTKDFEGKHIPSNISVTVVDNKLLTYVNDKQHNILSWLLLGYELKGKIYEPSYYFDEKNEIEKRLQGIDLLLNTQGWRKFNQETIVNLKYPSIEFKPEKSNNVEGFLSDDKNKPLVAKIMLFTDTEKVYETKSDRNGFFKFSKTHFESLSYLVIENKSNKKIKITNSVTDYKKFALKIDSLTKTGYKNKDIAIKGKNQLASNTSEQGEAISLDGNKKERKAAGQNRNVSLDEESSKLSEIVVVAYGSQKKSDITSSISIVRSVDILNASLAGKVAGIEIQSNSGQTDLAKVVIRGSGSLYGSRSGSQPLIVVDGIPIANNENSNVLGSISENNIQFITILKDASASALYGIQGVNGVIVVTTKNGNTYNQQGTIVGKQSNYTIEPINKFTSKKLTVPEQFYTPFYATTVTEEKNDFRNCLYWNGIIHTNKDGNANFEYYNSDDTTSFKILAEGISYKGDVGKNSLVYSVSEAFETDVKIPVFATVGDKIRLPLRMKNNSDTAMNLVATLILPNSIQSSKMEYDFSLLPNESKVVYLPIEVIKAGEKLPVSIILKGESYKNTISHEIDIYCNGFPVNIDISGTKTKNETFAINNMIPNSLQSGFKMFFNPFTAITDGLQSMLHEPHGCFEQVSSTNYPNIMALQLLNQNKMDETFKTTALGFLKNGYQKLKNYESKDGGFEWYGGNPGHEALTAYGLLQFHEMKEFIEIDQKLVDRSIKWLYSRKDNKGGFELNQGRYGFSSIKKEVNNAYLVYVLSEIGEKSFQKEYEVAYKEAIRSNDLYRVALLALASYNLGNKSQYYELNIIFRAKIKEEGLKNCTAEQTIVRSYGQSLNIELVSLYALSLLKEKRVTKEITEVLDFIQASKTSYGFGSTQATALALKAITQFSMLVKSAKIDNTVALKINETAVDTNTKDKNGNLFLNELKSLKEGVNSFSVNIANDESIPYLFYTQYQTYLPTNSTASRVELTTNLLQSKIKISQTSRLEITIKNKENEVVFNPIARIGIPGGTVIEPWQLKELVEKEVVDYYEIFGNELVLYFRAIGALETKKINIDFKAILSGSYTGVASSTYLYYNNQHKNWNKGLEVEIEE